jgi:hypothetical protein
MIGAGVCCPSFEARKRAHLAGERNCVHPGDDGVRFVALQSDIITFRLEFRAIPRHPLLQQPNKE